MRHAKKNRSIFVTKNWFLLLVFPKGKQRDKNNFVTKCAGIAITITHI